MKLLVCGGRSFADRDLVFLVLDRIHKETPIVLLIHGACGWDRDRSNEGKLMRGADRWADEWASERGVNCRREAARWAALGGKAGPLRNGHMLTLEPDMVLAFEGGPGTQGMVDLAHKKGTVVEQARRDRKEAWKAGVADVKRRTELQRGTDRRRK